MPEREVAAAPVERDVLVATAPADAWRWWTDPALLVRWMGASATVEARPGGPYRIAYANGAVMSGTVVEAVEGERLVFSWGWEDPAEVVRPGDSLVTVTFTPEGAGTRVRVRHTGLPDGEVAGHAEGWDYFLGRLVDAPASA